MGKKKDIVRYSARTEFNTETGEIKRVLTEEQIGRVESEPEYIKMYINTQLTLQNIDLSLAPAIIAFGPYITYANNPEHQHMIRTDNFVREGVAAALGVSTKRVEQLIKELVEVGIFIPIEVRKVESDGIIKTTKRRGVYFVNPFIVAKGAWADIKKLRMAIDFCEGTSSYVIEDGTGARTIKCNGKYFRDYHQISMEEYMNDAQKIEMPDVPFLPAGEDDREE